MIPYFNIIRMHFYINKVIYYRFLYICGKNRLDLLENTLHCIWNIIFLKPAYNWTLLWPGLRELSQKAIQYFILKVTIRISRELSINTQSEIS